MSHRPQLSAGRRRASIGIRAVSIFMLTLCAIAFSSRQAMTDSLVAVTSLGGLGANDSVAWSQIGTDSTTLSSTFNATSAGGLAITGTLAASGSLVSVVCPASPCSWNSPDSAGFNAGDSVIWTSDIANGGTGPLTLAFGSSVTGVGAMIQADGPAQFTAQVQAFNGHTSLGSFTTTSDSNGDAVFLGVLDNTAARITSVVYSLTACTGACGDFAIDSLAVNSTSATPTPSATTTASPGPTSMPTTSMLGEPARINFGSVDASGFSKGHRVKITNRGSIEAMVQAVSVPSGYSIVAGTDLCSNQVVPPHKSCTLMVQFAPPAPGTLSGSLAVTYNGAAPAAVTVSGDATPISLKAPAKVNFAQVAAGSTGNPRLVSISNPSKTASVQMGTANLSGPFTLASDTCSNASILPRGKCAIGLEFQPSPGSASKTTLAGALDIGFTYGSNGGSIPSITLDGKVR